jgi:hypothetical protein
MTYYINYFHATCQRSTIRCYGNLKLRNFKASISTLPYVLMHIEVTEI